MQLPEQACVPRLAAEPNVPGGQSCGDSEPAMQKEPMGQGAQAEREVALKAEEKLPGGQGRAAEVLGQYMP